ncbi:sulfatase family protein [Flavicella sediminum]|uniref:sulfatase family protein n=1 Tax=Flavicella sediminum TaxID=2585141 RepID=UPI00111CFCFE|nr:sulfatase [Flavicella sediminum]
MKIFKVSIVLFIVTVSALSAQNTKPNIIVIFADDLGYADLGSYGAEFFKTPNLDSMANNGMRYTDFYVGASVCSPSRAALLTGNYPIKSNMHKGVLFPFSKGGLLPSELTITEVLKSNGYKTACIGKWHLGHETSEYMPNNQGFDYYYGIPYSNDMDARNYPNQNYKAPPLPMYKNTEIVDEGMDQRFFTKRFTKESVEFITKNSDQPFFLYLAHPMPHTPVHVSPDFMHSSKYGRYGDAIQELDWSVGEIIKTVEAQGITNNTLILFTSDNGPDQGFWMGTNHGKATPLKGSKGTTWEGGMRVPLIATWPGKIPANTTNEELVTAMDIFPTVVNITQSKFSEVKNIDGRDVSNLLFNMSSFKNKDAVFFYYATNGKIEAVRKGNWKLHIAKTKGWDQTQGKFQICLFDLSTDFGEIKDLSKDFPKKVSELKALINDKNKADLK